MKHLTILALFFLAACAHSTPAPIEPIQNPCFRSELPWPSMEAGAQVALAQDIPGDALYTAEAVKAAVRQGSPCDPSPDAVLAVSEWVLRDRHDPKAREAHQIIVNELRVSFSQRLTQNE